MLRALLAKDFARVRRNPLPWVIYLLMPLLVVGVMGAIFGRHETLATIRFAVVDEDNTLVTRILRNSTTNDEFRRRLGKIELAPVFLDRAPALAQLEAGKLSAVIVIPAGFTRDYLTGRKVTFELVKNPAESLVPTFVEEAMGALATALDAVARNLAPDLAAWRGVLEGEVAWSKSGPLLEETGNRLQALGNRLDPPPVGLKKPATDTAAGDRATAGTANIFGFLLIGMTAMFLLFLGGLGMGDLHREIELRTLARYQTLRTSLASFIGAKVVFTGLMLLLCSAILLGGGAAAFGIAWSRPLPLLALTLGYTFFVAGLMAVIVAWIPDQRKADAARSLASMLFAMAGGCAFPPDNLPLFWREHVLPLLPTHWYAATARAVESGAAGTPWQTTALQLTLVGGLLLAAAAWRFRRHFAQEGRA